jgi:C-terminal processing protease CtpA/Prc
MIVTRVSTLILIALMLLGCATTPRYKGVPQGGNTDHVLGITADENLRVVEVENGSAAQKAGVQVDDVLVSLTWILSEAPEELPGTQDDVTQTVASTSTTKLRPPAGVEYKTIPFTDDAGIRTLIGYGTPLNLQVIRQGQTHELTIIPAPLEGGSAMPTASGHVY